MRARLAAAALGLLVVAGCSGTDPGATAATPSGAATATGSAPAAPRATTVVAGDPSVPLLGGNVADLGAAPTVMPGTGPAPGGLVVSDVVEGTGPLATARSTVTMRYVGAVYTTGAVFDATWSRGAEPVTYPLARLVPGFGAGVDGMRVGGRREVVIPPDLAYGAAGKGPVPPGATLVFVVDLVGVS